MTTTRSLAFRLLSLPAAAFLVLAASNGAVAAPSIQEDKNTVTSTELDPTGAAGYWTAERMESALPGDVLADKALERGQHSNPATVEKGKDKKVKGTKGKKSPENPVSHIGKIFFTLGGSNYVCSGNAVASVNESTVATAAHCLSNGPDVVPTRFIFVPGYNNGLKPYGEWVGKSYHVPAEWNARGDMGYDTGFVVVAPNSLGSLIDTVGGSGVAFNAPRGLPYTAFGYPAAKFFKGETLRKCTGTATEDTLNDFGTQGIPCDMTGGSSGGPWFIGDGPDGPQNSVNSYGYKGSEVMYGPYWGKSIEATYHLAEVYPPGLPEQPALQ